MFLDGSILCVEIPVLGKSDWFERLWFKTSEVVTLFSLWDIGALPSQMHAGRFL